MPQLEINTLVRILSTLRVNRNDRTTRHFVLGLLLEPPNEGSETREITWSEFFRLKNHFSTPWSDRLLGGNYAAEEAWALSTVEELARRRVVIVRRPTVIADEETDEVEGGAAEDLPSPAADRRHARGRTPATIRLARPLGAADLEDSPDARDAHQNGTHPMRTRHARRTTQSPTRRALQ